MIYLLIDLFPPIRCRDRIGRKKTCMVFYTMAGISGTTVGVLQYIGKEAYYMCKVVRKTFTRESKQVAMCVVCLFNVNHCSSSLCFFYHNLTVHTLRPCQIGFLLSVRVRICFRVLNPIKKQICWWFFLNNSEVQGVRKNVTIL